MESGTRSKDAPPPERSEAPGRSSIRRLLLPVLGAMALVAAAVALVGPAPTPADEGFPKAPPPLALPSDAPDDGPLSRAAALLVAGQLDDAGTLFTDVVAGDADDLPGQVGLVLSRWRSTGPVSVERDLRQLVREYPDSSYAMLHLALVQGLLEDDRGARRSLREAREFGLDAADPTSLRMAQLADDLLHPDAFRGVLPVLVAPGDVPAPRRDDLRALLEATRTGDRRAAARLATTLERRGAGDGFLRIAAVTATFDKADPDATVERLGAIAEDDDSSDAARDRARFMATLADLWGGGERARACAALARHAGPATDPGTRRLAGPISAELCT
jgi:hypothetical protein